MVGEETAHKYQTLVYLAGSASAEFFADIGLCPFEAVKVHSANAIPAPLHSETRRMGARVLTRVLHLFVGVVC